MAVALGREIYSPPAKGVDLWDPIYFRGLLGRPSRQTTTAFESPLGSDVSTITLPLDMNALDPVDPQSEGTDLAPDKKLNEIVDRALADDRNFEIAYHALADRRGVNATPNGRTASRKVWLDAGERATRWLIGRLRTEQHPETIIGIAETITEMGAVALPVVLVELEREEAKPAYAPLLEALSWMTLSLQPTHVSRIVGIIDRYLASSHIDCQVAAVQLTRLLDDHTARSRLDSAKKNAGQRLREEIEDLLSERFGD